MLEFLKLWPYLWPLIKEYVFGAPEPGKNRPAQPSIKGPWLWCSFIMLGLMFSGDFLAIVGRELEKFTVSPEVPKTQPIEPKVPTELQLSQCLIELNYLKQTFPKPEVVKTPTRKQSERKAAQERLERLKEEESKS